MEEEYILHRSSLSSLDLLRWKWTEQHLNLSGKIQLDNDNVLIVMAWTSTEEHCLSIEVGIGSRLQKVLRELATSLKTSSADTDWKEES